MHEPTLKQIVQWILKPRPAGTEMFQKRCFKVSFYIV